MSTVAQSAQSLQVCSWYLDRNQPRAFLSAPPHRFLWQDDCHTVQEYTHHTGILFHLTELSTHITHSCFFHLTELSTYITQSCFFHLTELSTHIIQGCFFHLTELSTHIIQGCFFHLTELSTHIIQGCFFHLTELSTHIIQGCFFHLTELSTHIIQGCFFHLTELSTHIIQGCFFHLTELSTHIQRRFGLPTDLTPFICHSVLLIVHLLSFIWAMCPAHFRFVLVMYWTTSVTLVLVYCLLIT